MEGICCIEFDEPISLDLPAEKAVELAVQTCYLAECNDVLAHMYGFEDTEDFVGERLIEVLNTARTPVEDSPLPSLLKPPYRVRELEYKTHDREGRPYWVVRNAMSIVEDHHVVRIWMTQRDVTERKRIEGELESALEENRRLNRLLEAENVYLREEIRADHGSGSILGESAALREALARVAEAAPVDTTVLILGETGTGKELVARAIHDAGPRKGKSLIKVDCASLPSNLIESELFGHAAGAFTGAAKEGRVGRFELADGGTVFLDEIGELPLDLQTRLLRVLQDGEFERVGSSETIEVDVRVVAATNRDLEAEIAAGRFRQDLYYRLNVLPIVLPPLRERAEDIAVLVAAFTERYARKHGREVDRISQAALEQLTAYSWPGNVRELENVIERAVVTARDRRLRIDLPQSAPDLSTTDSTPSEPAAASGSGSAHARTLDEVQREHIERVLRETGGRVEGSDGAAAILGLHPSTLRSRMKKLEIRMP